MTTYIFDLLVGYEPNGVDNSQVHRARVFDKQNIDYFLCYLPVINFVILEN